MILRLSLDLPEDGHYIRTTRLLSRCLLEDLGVTRDIIEDVETIVAELCSNVIRHAPSEAYQYVVVLEYYKPRVVITVTDTGWGFNQTDVHAVGELRPDGFGGMRLGGWGLSLLDGLSDKIDFSTTDPHGTTVRVEKNLIYETQEDADQATRRDASRGGLVAITSFV